MKNKMICSILALTFLIGASSVQATEPYKAHLSWKDLKMICEKVDVPFAAMVLLMHHEDGYVGLASKNTNGTYDYGPFQVNSIHISDSAFRQANITHEKLRYNGKVNAVAAAFLFKKALRKAFLKTGSKRWDDPKVLFLAIGNYHSMTPKVRRRYQLAFTKRMRSFKGVGHTLSRANR